ncbi:unnamed protein product [Cuscuta europaea]|uniref:HVA22-like protein n=1 Tax=Cuscuta europaea TaxID=41803 RepID=A0A9P0YH19_CUSEU|nr:unnamed protein product [Cuscuta europaea]
MLKGVVFDGLYWIIGVAYALAECFKEDFKKYFWFWVGYWSFVTLLTQCEMNLHELISRIPLFNEVKVVCFVCFWFHKFQRVSSGYIDGIILKAKIKINNTLRHLDLILAR